MPANDGTAELAALAAFARTLPDPSHHSCDRYGGPCDHETEAHERLYAWARSLPPLPQPPILFPESEGDDAEC